MAKLCISCIGVGYALKYREYQDHTRCLCCGHKEKRSNHILLYPDHKTKNNFKKAVVKILKPVVEEMKTEPKLVAAILDITFRWIKKETIIHTNYSTTAGIREAVKIENEGLGWTNFVLGR